MTGLHRLRGSSGSDLDSGSAGLRSSRKLHSSALPVMFCLAIIALDIFALVFGLSPDFRSKEYLQKFKNQVVDLSGEIMKDPDEAEGVVKFALGNLSLGEVALSGKVYVSASTKDLPELKRADRVELSGKLLDGFGTYIGFLYRPTFKSVRHSGDLFLELRDNFAEKISEYVPKESQGLALGYLLGERFMIADELEETIRTVGLTYMIVASGAHLGILTGFARKWFGKISRLAGFFGALIFTLVFIGITGLTPSMARAGIVTFLSLFAWYFGRDLKPARLILYAATATLFLDPSYPLDLAWLLSFASFSALLVVEPVLEKFFFGPASSSGARRVGKFASLILSSLSASLLCLPILMYFYRQTSLVAIVASVLIGPTLAVVMLCTFLTGMFAMLSLAPLAFLAGQATHFLIQYHIAVIDFFAAQKSFLVTVEAGNPLWLLLYVPILITFMLIHRRTTLKPTLLYSTPQK